MKGGTNVSVVMELLDEGVMISYSDDTGATVTKIVDFGDLAVTLAQQARMDTGILPLGTRYYTKSERVELLAIETAPKVRTLEYHTGVFKVPVPPLLFVVGLRRDNGSSVRHLITSYVYSLRTPLVDASSVLYRFPFGNVYDDASICWGSVRRPTFNDLVSFGIVPEIILTSRFNGDLDVSRFTPFIDENNSQVSTGAGLAQYLDGASDFRYDVLISECRFGDIVRRVLNGAINN